MEDWKDKYKAQIKYNKEHAKHYNFKIMLPQDEDIFNVLQAKSNKTGYIKSLIRNDIRKDEN